MVRLFMSTGERIKLLREAKSLSPEQLVTIIAKDGVTLTPDEIKALESPKDSKTIKFPQKMLESLAKNLDANSWWLMTGHGDPGFQIKEQPKNQQQPARKSTKPRPWTKNYEPTGGEPSNRDYVVPYVPTQVEMHLPPYVLSPNIAFTIGKSCGANPKDLIAYRVTNDSLCSYIKEGGTVLLNTRVKAIMHGKVYALQFGQEIVLAKLMRKMDDSFKIIFDNKLKSIQGECGGFESVSQLMPKIVGQVVHKE